MAGESVVALLEGEVNIACGYGCGMVMCKFQELEAGSESIVGRAFLGAAYEGRVGHDFVGNVNVPEMSVNESEASQGVLKQQGGLSMIHLGPRGRIVRKSHLGQLGR